MSPPRAPWFMPLPFPCRPIPPRCSLFLFVFAMVDDALPVTAPLHHFSHPLHEQDGEREEAEEEGEGVLQKDCEDETRGARQCQSKTKKKKKKQPCHFLSKCCCYLRESISGEHTVGTLFPFRRQLIHSPNKWPRKAWLFTVFPTVKAQKPKKLWVNSLIWRWQHWFRIFTAFNFFFERLIQSNYWCVCIELTASTAHKNERMCQRWCW